MTSSGKARALHLHVQEIKQKKSYIGYENGLIQIRSSLYSINSPLQ